MLNCLKLAISEHLFVAQNQGNCVLEMVRGMVKGFGWRWWSGGAATGGEQRAFWPLWMRRRNWASKGNAEKFPFDAEGAERKNPSPPPPNENPQCRRSSPLRTIGYPPLPPLWRRPSSPSLRRLKNISSINAAKCPRDGWIECDECAWAL